MSLELRAFGKTHVGKRRQHDEDTVRLSPTLRLFTVADGAGGHKAGEVASRLAALSIENYVAATRPAVAERPPVDKHGVPALARQLSAAVHKANRDVCEIGERSAAHAGMGTTVDSMLFDPRSPTVHLAHVGDSRCYRLRGDHFEQLTQDHTLIWDVLEQRPDLSEVRVDALPKHVVTRALGMGRQLRVDVRSFSAAAGDRYLLCTDGLVAPVPLSQVRDALILGEPPEITVQLLIDLALAAGGPDNVGVVVIDCVGRRERTLPQERPMLARRVEQLSEPELLHDPIRSRRAPAELVTPKEDEALREIGPLLDDPADVREPKP